MMKVEGLKRIKTVGQRKYFLILNNNEQPHQVWGVAVSIDIWIITLFLNNKHTFET